MLIHSITEIHPPHPQGARWSSWRRGVRRLIHHGRHHREANKVTAVCRHGAFPCRIQTSASGSVASPNVFCGTPILSSIDR
ncbi:MAG: hypothetical protein ACOYMC_14670, partial [Pirellulales bacterium]